ncbi:MAG: ATP-dependent DNA helicase PcrA [Spirochaetes bacterium ADurb.Bin218]|jgi:DNA helicase-2/ATP-dependent DNA helicase PcrA|nr:ATP-dependent helicase [Spirochaetota bacterium]OQA98469.1 MAG: ATP-dependent DNA helicase PcrA [Spirochaetes bacterium ADurb.Bin218]
MEISSEQKKAAQAERGISLVIAGAGTGKTTTMIEKIVNCINAGLTSPEKILLLTFSRKAAQEIRERVEKRMGCKCNIGFSGTFHAFCLSALRQYSDEYLRFKGFESFPKLLQEDEKNKLATDLAMERKAKFKGIPIDALLQIADSLDNLNDYMTERLKKTSLFDEISLLRFEILEYKKRNNLIEFEDMVNDTIALLKENQAIRQELIDRFNYIFVDEFQDTSHNNFELINIMLPEKGKNLFMVGDDFQSIYKFRGAHVSYFINIKKFLPEAKIFMLVTNYRSKKEIVSISNKFIRHNKNQTKKKIKSHRGKGGVVSFHKCENALEEIDIIKKIISDYGSSAEIAVLYRNNFQGEFIEKNVKCNDNVKFMTMHSSKGLEFDIVIIAGVNDKIIPDKGSDIEEERRLFYVALTRAKNNLHIIYQSSSTGRLPRFIAESGYKGI